MRCPLLLSPNHNIAKMRRPVTRALPTCGDIQASIEWHHREFLELLDELYLHGATAVLDVFLAFQRRVEEVHLRKRALVCAVSPIPSPMRVSCDSDLELTMALKAVADEIGSCNEI